MCCLSSFGYRSGMRVDESETNDERGEQRSDGFLIHTAKTIVFRIVEIPLRLITGFSLLIGFFGVVAVFVEPDDKLWRLGWGAVLLTSGAIGTWLTDWLLDWLCIRFFGEGYGVQIFRRRETLPPS
jgi:hypothetical protein